MSSSKISGPLSGHVVPVSCTMSYTAGGAGTTAVKLALPDAYKVRVLSVGLSATSVTMSTLAVTVGDNATADRFLASTALATGDCKVGNSADTAEGTIAGGTNYLTVNFVAGGATVVLGAHVVIWLHITDLAPALKRRG